MQVYYHIFQIRHPTDETQCITCPQGTVPDIRRVSCRDIPETYLRPESGWAIGAMALSSTGILVTLFVTGVFIRHNDTPVVRASGRELSYVLLAGILMCYCVTFALVVRPSNLVCGVQRWESFISTNIINNKNIFHCNSFLSMSFKCFYYHKILQPV